MPPFVIIILYALLAIAALLIIYMMAMLIAFHYAFNRKWKARFDMNIDPKYQPRIDEGRKILDSTPFEEVYVTASDGVRLFGQLYRGSKGDKTVILFHGYRSSPSDFCGAFKVYLATGCNILIVHQRAHGKSGGKYLSFGIKESYDCAEWARAVSEQIGGKIILGGISMGAATVMMAANKNLPSSVVAIVADCGYSSPSDIIAEVARKNFHIPKFLLQTVVSSMDVWCKAIGGFSIKSDSAVKALRGCKIPVVITHGEADDFVPLYMSELCYDACRDVAVLHTVKGATHGLAYLYDEPGCFAVIAAHLGENAPDFPRLD